MSISGAPEPPTSVSRVLRVSVSISGGPEPPASIPWISSISASATSVSVPGTPDLPTSVSWLPVILDFISETPEHPTSVSWAPSISDSAVSASFLCIPEHPDISWVPNISVSDIPVSVPRTPEPPASVSWIPSALHSAVPPSVPEAPEMLVPVFWISRSSDSAISAVSDSRTPDLTASVSWVPKVFASAASDTISGDPEISWVPDNSDSATPGSVPRTLESPVSTSQALRSLDITPCSAAVRGPSYQLTWGPALGAPAEGPCSRPVPPTPGALPLTSAHSLSWPAAALAAWSPRCLECHSGSAGVGLKTVGASSLVLTPILP